MTNKAKHIERLQNLKRVMWEVLGDKKPFDMHRFVGVRSGEFTIRSDNWLRDNLKSCGTSACAAGWCGLDPWFRHRRFVTKMKLRQVRINGEDAGEVEFAEFFGLTVHQATTIFYGWSNNPNDIIRLASEAIAEKDSHS